MAGHEGFEPPMPRFVDEPAVNQSMTGIGEDFFLRSQHLAGFSSPKKGEESAKLFNYKRHLGRSWD
jgi:hypothetical protein